MTEHVTNIDGTPFQAIPRLTPSAVRRARIMCGWSQGDLARAIKVTITAISHFETGRTKTLRPQHERAVIDAFAMRGVDVAGGGIRLKRPRLAAGD